MENLTKVQLTDIVVEELFDKGFKPGVQEAYAVATLDIPTDRIGSTLLRALDALDWERIEEQLLDLYSKTR